MNKKCFIGCPSVIRADKGTENVHVAAVQYALRREHNDGLEAEKASGMGVPQLIQYRFYVDVVQEKNT